MFRLAVIVLAVAVVAIALIFLLVVGVVVLMLVKDGAFAWLRRGKFGQALGRLFQ